MNGRRLAWKVWRRTVAGGLAASATAVYIAILTAPVLLDVPARTLYRLLLAWATPVFVVGMAAGLPLAHWIVGRASSWTSQDKPPSRDEIAALTAVPRMAALVLGSTWVVGVSSLFLVLTRLAPIHWTWRSLLTSIFAFAYCGVQGATIVYLLAERAVRPVVADVLPSDSSQWPRTMGLAARMLLAWVLLGGAPAMLLAANLFFLDPEKRAVAGPPFLWGGIAIVVVGFVTIVIAGQTITTPLERIRQALKRVADGDLNAELVADEAGEIGLLQAGFNQMVEGLRERERMRTIFGRHVGSEVAQRALATDLGLGGERCEATAMFVDIIGSTSIAQREDPDDVVAILNRFFDAVVRNTSAHGGVVNKFEGDGALCIFGAPVERTDHASCALKAACALARDIAAQDGFSAAIGISSGTVVAGNVGTADRYEFTVIGDPVNEASRLCDEAKHVASHVLASERTIQAAGATGWTKAASITLRGRSEATTTYEPATSSVSPPSS
jgi:adenylate cyclase